MGGLRGVSICLIALPCLFWPAPGFAQQVTPSTARYESIGLSPPDNVCGARCVHYLLRHYQGVAPDLMEIVRQIQWPDVSAGATLADMKDFLESHGVRTKAMKVAPGHMVESTHPCILHLRPSAPTALGHYVILLPGSDRSYARVLDLDGVKELPTWELLEKCSGAVLLTGPPGQELSGEDARVVMATDTLVRRSGYLSLAILTIGSGCLVWRLQHRPGAAARGNVAPVP